MGRSEEWRKWMFATATMFLMSFVAFSPNAWPETTLCDSNQFDVTYSQGCDDDCMTKAQAKCDEKFGNGCTNVSQSYTHSWGLEDSTCTCIIHCEVSNCHDDCP